MNGDTPYDGTERRARERSYHRDFARRHAGEIRRPVELDVVQAGDRHWWDADWCAYDALLAMGVRGSRVLVPGCGLGGDAIRLSLMGADVHAFDLSAEQVDVAAMRARAAGAPSIHFDVMPAESLTYPDGWFDLIFFNDCLRHLDLGRALAEALRVARPGAGVVINELYTHSALQRVRNSALITRRIYPRMVRLIYGTDRPYITADEHKLDERALDQVRRALPAGRLDFFLMFEGRLFPSRWAVASRADRAALRALGPNVGRLVAGRFLLSARLAGG